MKLIEVMQEMGLKTIQLLFPAYDTDRYFPEPGLILEEMGRDYEIMETVLGHEIPVHRYAHGLDVISSEFERVWEEHPLAGEDGERRLGFAVFDT